MLDECLWAAILQDSDQRRIALTAWIDRCNERNLTEALEGRPQAGLRQYLNNVLGAHNQGRCEGTRIPIGQMEDTLNRTGLVVIWARRLIAQRSAWVIVNANASTLRLRVPLFPSPGGIMDIPFQLLGFALPFVTIYLLFRLVRNTEPKSSRSNPWPTAIELLDERFARGEISEEQYRELKRVLIEEDLRRRAEL